jgi:hypothetical protein
MLYRNEDGSFAYGYGSNSYDSNIRYVDARNTQSVRYTASASNSIKTNRNLASASASSTFLPNSFFGWVFVLFLLSVFVIVLRRLVNHYYTKETVIVH